MKGKHERQELGIARGWGDNTEPLTKTKWFSNPKSVSGNLPQRAALEVMVAIIATAIAAEQTTTNHTLVHSGARRPATYKSSKQAHTKYGAYSLKAGVKFLHQFPGKVRW